MFNPASRLLHIRGTTTTLASRFLLGCQDQPYAELRHAHPVAVLPETGIPKKATQHFEERLSHIEAQCPATGRLLRLHAFHDMSAVVLRQSASGEWEAFVEPLFLGSMIHDVSAQGLSHEERDSAANLRIQARPDGLRMKALNCDVSPDEVRGLYAAALVEVATELLARPPAADPRAHRMIPEGARFVEHSLWPAPSKSDPDLKRARDAISAFISVVIAREDIERADVAMHRIEIPRWGSLPQARRAVSCLGYSSQQAWIALSDWAKGISEAIVSGVVTIPDCYRFGPREKVLLEIRNIERPASAHELLQVRRLLQDMGLRLTPSGRSLELAPCQP